MMRFEISLLSFHTMIQTQFQTQIQILCTSNDTEYLNHILHDYIQNYRIIYQSSCVDTSQQNGIAKQKNKHLLEVEHDLMFTTNMSKSF